MVRVHPPELECRRTLRGRFWNGRPRSVRRLICPWPSGKGAEHPTQIGEFDSCKTLFNCENRLRRVVAT